MTAVICFLDMKAPYRELQADLDAAYRRVNGVWLVYTGRGS